MILEAFTDKALNYSIKYLNNQIYKRIQICTLVSFMGRIFVEKTRTHSRNIAYFKLLVVKQLNSVVN
jgi:hypothetical protein